MGKRGQKRQRSAATSEQQQQQQRHQRATDHDARPATRQNVQITLSSHADQKHRRLSKRAQRRQHDRTTLKIDVSARLKASELTGAGLVRKLNLEIGKEEGEQSEDGGSDDNLYQSDEEEVEDWYEFYQMNHNPSSSPRSWSGREQLGSSRTAESGRQYRPELPRLGPTVYEPDSSELEELAKLQKKSQPVSSHPAQNIRRNRLPERRPLGPTVYECDSSELEELAKLQKKSQPIPARPAENTKRPRPPERRPLGPTVYECDSSELEELARLQKKRQSVPPRPTETTRRHRPAELPRLGPTVYECDSSELEELAKLQKENKRTAESTKRHKPPKLPRLRPTTYEVNSSELAELQKESQRAAENTRRHRPAELPRLGPTVYECSSSGLAELAELEKEQQRLDAETLKIIHVSTKAKTVARQLLSSPNRTPQSGSEEPIEWPSSSPAHKTATVSSRTAVSLPYSPYPTKQPPSKKKPSRVLFTTPSGVNFYHRKYYGQSKVYNEWVPLTIADVLKLQEHKMVNTDDFFWKNHPIRNVFIVGLCVGVRQPKDDRVLYIDIDDASGHELVCKVKKRQPIDDHATRLLDMDTPFLIQAAGTIGIYTRGSERIRQLECDSSDRVTVIDDAHHEIRFLRKLLEMRKVLDVPWELSEEKCKEMDKQVFIN
ncbi:telomere regulation protein Stn1-domain-containing protein [Myxozyma melibiosi]|uniref:Telomere regulation protein Stn1-domain-containing protein n=1 Tax=Myxozyma melibiosi TaxID=54550 RepID=A0ABR1F5M9_9ASCO